MPPGAEGAAGAGAALSLAAVCGGVAWASAAAGERKSPIRAATRIDRISYDFQLMIMNI